MLPTKENVMKPNLTSPPSNQLIKKHFLIQIGDVVAKAYGAGITLPEAQAICGAAWGDFLDTHEPDQS